MTEARGDPLDINDIDVAIIVQIVAGLEVIVPASAVPLACDPLDIDDVHIAIAVDIGPEAAIGNRKGSALGSDLKHLSVDVGDLQVSERDLGRASGAGLKADRGKGAAALGSILAAGAVSTEGEGSCRDVGSHRGDGAVSAAEEGTQGC